MVKDRMFCLCENFILGPSCFPQRKQSIQTHQPKDKLGENCVKNMRELFDNFPHSYRKKGTALLRCVVDFINEHFDLW